MFESRVDVPPSQKPVFSSTASLGDQASKRDKVRTFSLFLASKFAVLSRDLSFITDIVTSVQRAPTRLLTVSIFRQNILCVK